TATLTRVSALFSTAIRGRPVPKSTGAKSRPSDRNGSARQRSWNGRTASAHLGPTKTSKASGATTAIPKKVGNASKLTASSAWSMPPRRLSRSSWVREKAEKETCVTMDITLSNGMEASESATEYSPTIAPPSARPAMAISRLVYPNHRIRSTVIRPPKCAMSRTTANEGNGGNRHGYRIWEANALNARRLGEDPAELPPPTQHRTPPTETCTLSLHDALPICTARPSRHRVRVQQWRYRGWCTRTTESGRP